MKVWDILLEVSHDKIKLIDNVTEEETPVYDDVTMCDFIVNSDWGDKAVCYCKIFDDTFIIHCAGGEEGEIWEM